MVRRLRTGEGLVGRAAAGGAGMGGPVSGRGLGAHGGRMARNVPNAETVCAGGGGKGRRVAWQWGRSTRHGARVGVKAPCGSGYACGRGQGVGNAPHVAVANAGWDCSARWWWRASGACMGQDSNGSPSCSNVPGRCCRSIRCGNYAAVRHPTPTSCCSCSEGRLGLQVQVFKCGMRSAPGMVRACCVWGALGHQLGRGPCRVVSLKGHRPPG